MDSGAESSTAVSKDLVAASCLAGAFFLLVPHQNPHVTTCTLSRWTMDSMLQQLTCPLGQKGTDWPSDPSPEGIKESADCHMSLLLQAPMHTPLAESA